MRPSWIQKPRKANERLERCKQSSNLQVTQVVKNLPTTAGDVRNTGSIPGLGRSLEEGMVTHSSILACRSPWTEEPGGLQSVGSHRVGHNDSNLAPVALTHLLSASQPTPRPHAVGKAPFRNPMDFSGGWSNCAARSPRWQCPVQRLCTRPTTAILDWGVLRQLVLLHMACLAEVMAPPFCVCPELSVWSARCEVSARGSLGESETR